MPITKSPRMGLTRWSSDADEWDRADFDSDNALLEDVAIDVQGANLAALGPAGVSGRYGWALDTERLYRSNGTAWVHVASNAATKTYSSGTITAGASINIAPEPGPGAPRETHAVVRQGSLFVAVDLLVTATIASGAVLFTLPVGARPMTRKYGWSGILAEFYNPGSLYPVYIEADGDVVLYRDGGIVVSAGSIGLSGTLVAPVA